MVILNEQVTVALSGVGPQIQAQGAGEPSLGMSSTGAVKVVSINQGFLQLPLVQIV